LKESILLFKSSSSVADMPLMPTPSILPNNSYQSLRRISYLTSLILLLHVRWTGSQVQCFGPLVDGDSCYALRPTATSHGRYEGVVVQHAVAVIVVVVVVSW